jgi:hypothetical protein
MSPLKAQQKSKRAPESETCSLLTQVLGHGERYSLLWQGVARQSIGYFHRMTVEM